MKKTAKKTSYICQMFTEMHSPLQQLPHTKHPKLWMKRDDLIDPYISGNKWRKLKYILKAARAAGKSHLVTYGGAYSNHLVATAAAAARSGLKSSAFVRGEEVNNEMLILCKLYGMNLIFTSREAYREPATCYNKLFANNPDTYAIPEGGASEEAVRGCAEIIDELPADTAHIICAAGTGTTAAGLLKGIVASGRQIQLHVVPVLKGGDFITTEIIRYEPFINQLSMHLDYHFGGYAKTKPELLQYMQQFIAKTGILIDPVYTAKMCFATEDLITKGILPVNEKVIALHTGGLLGIMGMKDKFIF
ncbi:1-aminocyclopropane-1-carboxylate deaminase/D-cysteine desulfhydrase [Pedobacter antarcticus]|uniref:1-aminocyclopropane-1-carboxylate deaminase/D-cysteine desulfhydrase n=1 Tax=Pedobacter antarcticus TaxID=34086 RepID=UPI0031400912